MHVRSYAHCASTHIPRSVKFEFLDPKNILDTGRAMERALCNRGFVCNESRDKSPATCLVSQPLSPLAYALSLRNLYYKLELHSALSIAHSVCNMEFRLIFHACTFLRAQARSYAPCASTHVSKSVKFEILDPKKHMI